MARKRAPHAGQIEARSNAQRPSTKKSSSRSAAAAVRVARVGRLLDPLVQVDRLLPVLRVQRRKPRPRAVDERHRLLPRLGPAAVPARVPLARHLGLDPALVLRRPLEHLLERPRALEEPPQPLAGRRHLLRRLRAEGVLDGDLLRLPGALLDGRHPQQPVQVQAHPAQDLVRLRGGREAHDPEVPHQQVPQRVLVLTLVDLDVHLGLVGMGGGVGLDPRHRQRGIALDHRPITVRIGRPAPDPQVGGPAGKRRHVDEHPFHRNLAQREASTPTPSATQRYHLRSSPSSRRGGVFASPQGSARPRARLASAGLQIRPSSTPPPPHGRVEGAWPLPSPPGDGSVTGGPSA